MTTLLHVDASARSRSISRSVSAAFNYQQRYLRDFFAGHFAVTDTAFINAELVNSRHDPALAHLRDDHERSYALALESARRLGKEY